MRRVVVGFALLALFVLVPQASAWSWPLQGEVLRPYSLGPDAYAAGQHRGIDVAGAAGDPFAHPQTEPCPSRVSCPARATPSRSSSRAMPSPSHTSAISPSRRARRSPRVTPSAWPGRVATPNGRRPTSISEFAFRRQPTGTSIRRRSCRRGSPLAAAEPVLCPDRTPAPLRLRSRRRAPPRVPPLLPPSRPRAAGVFTVDVLAVGLRRTRSNGVPRLRRGSSNGSRPAPGARRGDPAAAAASAAADPVVASAGTASGPAPLPRRRPCRRARRDRLSAARAGGYRTCRRDRWSRAL